MDRRLVLKARDGDPEAFMTLAIACHPRLFSTAFGILRDRGLAEDATQRALVDVWRHLRGLRDPCRFDGWSYRMGARFAGRVRIAVYPDTVAVSGPRVPSGIYKVWVWLQSLLLAAVFPALAAAIVLLDWRYLLLAVGLFVLSFAVSMGGAGLWPGLGELTAEDGEGRLKALEFPRDAIREIDIGKGWSKGGFEVILFPYLAGINNMAEGRAVSFFAPDETGHEVRFALDMYVESKATELATLLGST